MNPESLSHYGIDYEKGLKNCMCNTEFYKKILTMFLNDSCFSRAKTAFQTGNRKEMFICMHELKGMSGNVAITELYSACVPLVEQLRNDEKSIEESLALFNTVENAYSNACIGIRKYLEESNT